MSSSSDPKYPPPPPRPPTMGYPANYQAQAPPPQPYYYTQAAPPVTAPPPHSYYYSSYPTTTTTSYYSPFARRLFAAFVTVLIILGAATFIAWLVLRPKLPIITVTSFSAAGFNTSSNSITADFRFSLLFQNPNSKMAVSYYSFSVGVVFAGDEFAGTSLPPFSQPKRSNTTVSAHIVAAGDYVGPDVDTAIAQQRKTGNGVVNFQLRGSALAVYNAGRWRTRRHVLKLFCDDVGVRFGDGVASNGTMVASSKPCLVSI